MIFGFLMPSGYALALKGDGRRMQVLAQAAALERMGHRVVRLDGWDNTKAAEIDALHMMEGALGNSVGSLGKPPGMKLMGVAPFIDSNQPNWSYRVMAWIGSRHPQFITPAGLYHRQMNACDVVIVRSSHERDRVIHGIGAPASRVKIVLNGVDPPEASDPELARRMFDLPRDYLLHVSLYSEPRKNVLRLIEAAGRTGHPLIIAGNPSGGTEMLAAIRTAAARAKNVRLLDFQEPRVLQSLYAGARVFCLPSLHEGTGLVALEAAAQGAGVVITRNGGPRDYFKELAYYVDPLDVDGMRDAITRAWEKPNGKELRQHVLTNLTWDQSALSLAAAYTEAGPRRVPAAARDGRIEAGHGSSGVPVATVVITTRNRKADTLQAIASCYMQDVPVEIIVFDDFSTDGTADAVREKYPGVRTMRTEKQEGYIRLRNLGARMAVTPYIFSIDDDAVFTTPQVVRQTLADFDDPRVGAVGIPFKNVRISEEVIHVAPDRRGVYAIHGYVGTAHALRRDLFLALGGYRTSLIHQGEESDYCIRMLNAGYITRAGRADFIHHFLSPVRDWSRMHYFGTRNSIIFHWHNAPLMSFPFRVLGATAANLLYAARSGTMGIKLRAIIMAYADMFRLRKERKPVSPVAHRLFRRLRYEGPIAIEKIAGELQPLLPLEKMTTVEGNLPSLLPVEIGEECASTSTA